VQQVSDDNNFGNAQDTSGLIDTISNNEEFGFSSQNIHNVIDCLGNSFVTNMNMSDGGDNIVFDTGIGNYESIKRI